MFVQIRLHAARHGANVWIILGVELGDKFAVHELENFHKLSSVLLMHAVAGDFEE